MLRQPDQPHRAANRLSLIDQLGVERVETVVPQRDLELLGFLYSTGFGVSPRLVFTRTLEPA